MEHAEFVKQLEGIVSELDEYARNEAPRLIGKIAVDHFTENFQKEGFVNGGLQKWQEVKRRENPSKKYPSDATRLILTGRSGALGRSLEKQETANEVTIFSTLPYAAAHNEGTSNAGRSRSVTIPQRQFMGESKELDELIIKEINRKLKSLPS